MLPLLHSQGHHLDPQGPARTQPGVHLASLTSKEGKGAPRRNPLDRGFLVPCVLKTNLSHQVSCLAPLQLCPWSQASAPRALCPNVGWPWGSRFHQKLCSLLFLSLKVALAQEQLGDQGEEGTGQSCPLPMPAWWKPCQRELLDDGGAVRATGTTLAHVLGGCLGSQGSLML